MLKQSSLGGNVHWTFPFAVELRVDPPPADSGGPASERGCAAAAEPPAEEQDQARKRGKAARIAHQSRLSLHGRRDKCAVMHFERTSIHAFVARGPANVRSDASVE